MTAVGLEALAAALPAKVVTNADLAAENPTWQMEKVAAKSGVRSRHIAAPGETALDLAVRAAEAIAGQVPLDTIDGIVFCTQTPDFVMPSNAFLLQERLGLADRILAFDFNLACSGFVYGLAICRGLILGGQARRLLLVNADTYSRLINPGDRSARVLFGDGAAATVVSSETARLRLVDFELTSSGRNWRKFCVPAGGFRERKAVDGGRAEVDASGNRRSREDIYMDGLGVWSFISSAMPGQINRLLARNGLAIGDVDLFVFHQASALTLDSLERSLRIPAGRSYRFLETVGNTVSASIPIALHQARQEGRLVEGMRVLISGFGVGLSAATAIVEV
jgi:3-oxoacyl-[acyl-carrier-protein] synthase-3